MLSSFGSKLYAWCYKSETIIWARIQALGGILLIAWTAVSSTDMTAIITNPKYLALWLMFNSFMTELLRRRKTEVIEGSLVKRKMLPDDGPLVNTNPAGDKGPGDVGSGTGPDMSDPKK